jgi:Flp pilus assembly protein TadD
MYNIGLIYGNTGIPQALEFYHQALSLNPNLPQALNNIAVIYHQSSTCTKS